MLVGFPSVPMKSPTPDVSLIKNQTFSATDPSSSQAEEEPSLSGLNINKGDQVKITDGAFESYEGGRLSPPFYSTFSSCQ